MRAKEELPECTVATAVSLIGGKWKLLQINHRLILCLEFKQHRNRDL